MVKFITSLFLLIPVMTLGQTVFYQTLQTDEFEVLITSDGRLFHTGGDDSLCESPNGGTFFREAGFWISAVSSKGNHKAAHHHKTTSDYGFGPLDTLLGLTAGDQARWNRVWKLRKQDITDHKNQFQLGEYVAPFDLKTWPVHLEGDYPEYNAPFIDYDQNGMYEPDSGDYPFVPGDQMIYSIYNDATGEGNTQDGFSLNTEIRAKYWVDQDQPHMLFFDLVFYNRNTTQDYDSTYVGLYADGILGETEAYGQTDLYQTAVYVYHSGNSLAEFNGGVPAGGFFFEDQDLHSSVILDGVSPHRKLPTTAREFRNVLEGSWTNGEKMTVGDSGIAGTVPTSFSFGGSTYNSGNAWIEENTYDKGRRYLIGSVKVGKWNRGNYKQLKGAIVMSNHGGLHQVKSAVNEVKYTASVAQKASDLAVVSWPNPSEGDVTIGSKWTPNSYIQVYTPDGRLVYNHALETNHVIPCNVFKHSGIYIIQVKRPRELITVKQVIQR